MDWRIIAAALAVVGVLAGGTLLAAQVQTDLDDGVQQRTKGGLEPPADSPPLKLNDFKLPKSMPLEIPPNSQISPDLSKITIPKDMEIQLPEDLDLSGLNFELPEDFELKLPPGSEFSAPDLKLPNGATIKLPDGREFKLPPGSELKLPPELVERLVAQGLPAGALAGARDLKVSDLPPGLNAQLDPPAFDGAGSLRLPAGTTVTLPDGSRFPFPAGALGYAARYLLPAGTSFDIPFDAIGSGGGSFPVPVPRSNSQLRGSGGPPIDGIPVETEITTLPSRVRKGDPVTVSGYVRELGSGRAVAGAPVDVFMNESKRTPGVLVGHGTTDASGTFVIKLTLPADKPAREYQLVNHAVAFVDGSGRAFADGWGDPPFATFASTALTLDIPARDGFGAATTIAGDLLDHEGAGVPGATVVVSVDGVVVGRPVTNANGRFALTYTFPAGTHTVTARFGGTSNYEASNTATARIAIDDYAIEIAPVVRAKPGEGIHLTGRVLAKGGIADDRQVLIDNVFGAGTVDLVSDSSGRFSYAFATSSTQPPGAYTLTYTLPQHGITKTQLVELNQTGQLSLDAPASADAESSFPVRVRVTSTEGNAIPSQSVRVTLSGPGGSRDFTGVTDLRGSVTLDVAALRPAAGTYTLTARVVNSPNLDAAAVSQTITLGSFQVTWNVPSTVVRGQEMSGTATLRFAGRPYTAGGVTLDLFGPIASAPDANGVVRFNAKVPTVATLGAQTITITALDHPARSTSFQVVAVPRLALDTPASFAPGSDPEARLTLTDDQGDPIRNAFVAVTVRGPEGEQKMTVATDTRGRWSGPLNLTTLGEGNVTVTARYDGGGTYLADEDVKTMSVAAPRPLVAGAPWWALPLVGLVLAGGGGAAWWYVKHKPRRVPVEAAAAPVVAAATVERPSDVQLAFAIPPGEPAVWGVGEPLALHVRNVGAPGTFDLSWNGGSRVVELAEDADVSTELVFEDEGEVGVTVRRQASDALPERAILRIVDYRKETAREFDLFLEKARAVDPALTKRSTPREISWTLEMRLPPEAREPLEEIASVLEVTNYSHYEVSRAHYLRFVRASRALDALFAQPAAQGG